MLRENDKRFLVCFAIVILNVHDYISNASLSKNSGRGQRDKGRGNIQCEPLKSLSLHFNSEEKTTIRFKTPHADEAAMYLRGEFCF